MFRLVVRRMLVEPPTILPVRSFSAVRLALCPRTLSWPKNLVQYSFGTNKALLLGTVSRNKTLNAGTRSYNNLLPASKSFNSGSILKKGLRSASHSSDSKKQHRRYIKYACLVLFFVGILLSARFRWGIYDSYLIAKRVGVVTVATTKCFGLYLRTLRKKFPSQKEYQIALAQTHKKAATITLNALRTNGGIYIKIGQHLGAMTYLLPFEWTDTMTPLQDECPQSSFQDIKDMFKHDTGIDLEDYFSEFEHIPVGTASLAQVHIAKLKSSGAQVAVKVEHPSLAKFVPLDVWLTRTVFNLMYKVFPQYPLTWLGDELQSSIYVELDFRNEARNAKQTDKYFRPYHHLTALRIPKVYSCKKRILIMEYVGGARLDNLVYMDKHNISRSEVSSCLSHIFNNMIFQSGFVHCDPHHGNLSIRALSTPKDGHNFEIVLYDHGLYRTIPQSMKVDYARFWLAMLDKKPDLMCKYGKRFAHIGDDKYPILAAALTGRDLKHATSGDIEDGRSQQEIDNMRELLMDDGMILDLMSLLASVPRIVLLIFKTNDLVRHLDESLRNPLGNERTFFIMATYCAKTVLDDDLSNNDRDNKRWSLKWLINGVMAWSKYYNRSVQLHVFDFASLIKQVFQKARKTIIMDNGIIA